MRWSMTHRSVRQIGWTVALVVGLVGLAQAGNAGSYQVAADGIAWIISILWQLGVLAVLAFAVHALGKLAGRSYVDGIVELSLTGVAGFIMFVVLPPILGIGTALGAPPDDLLQTPPAIIEVVDAPTSIGD